MQTNQLRADTLRAAMQAALDEQYGLYKLRVCLFDIFKGTAVNASKLADIYLPVSGVVNAESLSDLAYIPVWIEQSPDDDLSSVRTAVRMWWLIQNVSIPGDF